MRTACAIPGAGLGNTNPEGAQAPPEHLTPEEILAILSECRDTTIGVQGRTLATVMYHSGLGVSEALSLEPRDVGLHIGAMQMLHGKGERRRTIGVDPGASPVIEVRGTVRREHLAPPVFPVPRWIDIPGLQPKLKRFGDDNGPRAVSRRCHIHQRDEVSRKRYVDLAKIRSCHATNVSHRRVRFKRSVCCGRCRQGSQRRP